MLETWTGSEMKFRGVDLRKPGYTLPQFTKMMKQKLTKSSPLIVIEPVNVEVDKTEAPA